MPRILFLGRGPVLLSLVLLAAPGCLDVEPPDGVLACGSVADCPDETWTCRDNGAGASRCYRGEGGDAGMPEDTSTMDVPTDTHGSDTGDTGGDAGMPDTRPACVDPAVDCPAEDTCSVYACVDGECAVQDRECDDGITCTEDRCVMAGAVGCVNTPGGPTSCGVGLICAPDADDADPTTGCATAPECTIAAGCNDGDACTIDDCVDGSCTFTPMTCPNDSDLCTEPSVCVAGSCTPQSPISCPDDANMCTGAGVCNPGTGACSYPPITCSPDSSACTGPVTCAPSTGCMEPFNTGSLTNVDACGTSASMCVAPCPNRAGAVRTCLAGTCGFTCMSGFVDLNGTAGDGCEYMCTLMTPTDAPDLGAVDANCDGADGDIAGGRVIYVSPTGTGDGTRPGMAANLAMAFTILNGSGGRNLLLLQAGSYTTSSPLSTTVNFEMWGGYASDYRSRTGTSTVTSTAPTALSIRNVTSAAVVGVNFTTTTRTVIGESSHTVDVINSSNVRFTMLTVTAGAGARGVDGGAGATGIPGTNGMNGAAAPNPASPGMGGGSGAGRGGNGGAPSSMGFPGTAGDVATCPSGAPAGSPGGGGMQISACMSGFATDGGPGGTGGMGCMGTIGMHGTAGTGDGALGMLAGEPTWIGPLGDTGGLGAVGARGGGGGGGGGISCPLAGAAAGGGGSGGGGGGGGRGGAGGGPGGASIGILVMSSTVVLDGVSVTLGLGGPGGRGGDGGLGGAGGAGGGGGAGASISSGATTGTGGMGGVGGRGGSGGRGGCGGGGVGGVMAGVFRDGGSTVTQMGGGLTVTGGGASMGGPACSAGGGTPGDPGRMYSVFP